jgi:hypothetical protein
MNWEQRWREMLLAGGVLAHAGCGDPSEASKAAASDADTDSGYVCCTNGGTDPCLGSSAYSVCQQAESACGADGGSFIVGAGEDGGASWFCELPLVECCNANPDPCCTCNGTPINATECGLEMACQAGGGTYDPLSMEGTSVDGGIIRTSPGCKYPADAGSADAGPGDAGPTGAGARAPGPD